MTAQAPAGRQAGKARRQPILNLWAQTAVFIAFCFSQDPRWIAPDTKLDLTVNPGGFLSRAFVLWDPQAAAGQLQNQAYGYLFPSGPFFWLGHAMGLPAWVIQRTWWCIVLLVGFHGMRLLLERFAVGSSASRIIASFAYALAPRMLEGLGAVSSEIWPMAVAPWVLLPLVSVTPGGERRAAARSAVAVLFAGAVNAVATIAILVLPAWWIMTRSGNSRARLGRWWMLCIAGVCLWWAGPLVLLGRYSPPFLDWIESSQVTTSGASLTEALRGTTQWIAAIVGGTGPQWPAGWQILTSSATIALGLALWGLGLVGLWTPSPAWRTFARGGLVLGLLLVTGGHVSSGVGPQTEVLARLLDGPLAALRNTHKFEPAVRIVLCLGLAQGLPRVTASLRRAGSPVPWVAALTAVLAVVAQAAAPAFLGVSQRGRYLAVPSYWSEAAAWLAQNPSSGRTLVVPGASAPASYWGDPRDEPLQPLASAPWIVRDGVPLGSAGATRLLNDIEARIASGYGGVELSNDLARLGISRVLLRADLNYRVVGAPAPMVVRSALRSAGGTQVHEFGPAVGGTFATNSIVDGGQDAPTPSITVWNLAEPTSIAPTTLRAADSVVTISGGPEATALLPDAKRPTVLSSDAASRRALGREEGTEVLTDTLQRREATFAAVRDNYGPVLARDTDYPGLRGGHDWLMPWLRTDPDLSLHQTVEELVGAQSVQASSSLAYPGFGQARDLTRVAVSAFDASADTMWESSGSTAEGQYIEVTWAKATSVPDEVTAVFDMAHGADLAAVTITTDSGTVRTPITAPGTAGLPADRYVVQLKAPPGLSQSLRLTIAEVRVARPTVRLRDLGVGQLPRVEAWLRLPAPTGSVVDGVLLQASPSRIPACVSDGDDIPRCNPGPARVGEGEVDLRRVFALPTAETFTVTGTAWPREQASAASLIDRRDSISVAASTTWIAGATMAPGLLVDGDPRTYWAAKPDDKKPSLTIRFPTVRTFSGLRLQTDDKVAGRRAVRVAVKIGGLTYERDIGADGTVRFPEVTAGSATVEVLETTAVRAVNGLTVTDAPLVLGELNLIGGAWPGESAATVAVPCGFGPRLQVNGTEYPTRVSGSRSDFINGRPLELEACGTVRLDPGVVHLRLLASAEFAVRTLSLVRPGSLVKGAPAAPDRVKVVDWPATARKVSVAETSESAGVLTVIENANAGWTASTGTTALTPVTVDGWAQGWLTPAGLSGAVHLDFRPQRLYVAALLVGGFTALVVVGMALVGRRRRVGVVMPEVVAPRWVRGLCFTLAMVLLGGAWGLVAGAAVLGLRLVVAQWRRSTAWALATAVLLVWVAWAAVAPWPDGLATNRGLPSQVLALIVVAMALCPPTPLSRGPARAVQGRTGFS